LSTLKTNYRFAYLKKEDVAAVAAIAGNGTFVSGNICAFNDVLRRVTLGAGSGGMSVARVDDTVVGVVGTLSSGKLCMHVKVVAIAAPHGCDPTDFTVAATEFVKRTVFSQNHKAWLVADAPVDDASSSRMGAAGWFRTQTVNNGMRRHLLTV